MQVLSSIAHSENSLVQMVGRHENIVNLLGVCSQPLGQPLLVVLEFAHLGNLREFVQVLSCHIDTVIRHVCPEATIARGTLLQADVGQHNTGSKIVKITKLYPSLLSGCAWNGVSCK